jgi:hypothetical protein
VERCLACEAEGAATPGALPRLRGRGEQGRAVVKSFLRAALYGPAIEIGDIACWQTVRNPSLRRADTERGKWKRLCERAALLTFGLDIGCAVSSRSTRGVVRRASRFRFALYFTASGTSLPRSTKVKEAEFRQKRNPVGGGPSSNTCPK